MKKVFLIAIFAICGMQFMNAQVFVKEQNINDLADVKYIQLIGINTSMFGKKMEVLVDYGQKQKLLQSTSIRNSEGEVMKFNSMVAALNFMEANGWEFVDYKESLVKNKLRYVYLLKKKPE